MDTVHLSVGAADDRSISEMAECATESGSLVIEYNESSKPAEVTFETYSVESDSASLDFESGRMFFDSLSSSTSPMMKSIADITAIQDSETTAIDEFPSQNIVVETGSEHKVVFSVGDETDKSAVVEPCAIAEEAIKQSVLRSLFSEDRCGSDQEGKAFFDHISSHVDSHSSPAVPSSVAFTDSIIPPSPSSTSTFFVESEDIECYYSAWIPSSATQKILISVVTAVPGTFFPDREQLTMPGVIFEESSIVDPVKVLLTELQMPIEERLMLTVDNVSQDENGLRQLIKCKCYHAAINLTTRLLSGCQQGPGCGGHPSRHTPYSLQLWYTRLALLIKLRKFSYAEIESEVFGDLDKPDIYYEFYSESGRVRKGSMAPFSFRILLAELPQYQGNYQKTIEKLYALLAVVEKILENLSKGLAEDGSMMEISDKHRKASTQLWLKRETDIYYSILNCVLAQRDFVVAVHIVQTLLEKDAHSKARLYCALGRINLQLGDIKAASLYFHYFSETSEEEQRISSVQLEVDKFINKALMAIAQNGYPDAYEYFSEAYALQPQNPMLANNMAVTLLYMGKLKESLAILEKIVQSNPEHCLHEGILFNICVLYELESSASLEKKKEMLRLVAQHTGDSFQTTCLKIDTTNRNIMAR